MKRVVAYFVERSLLVNIISAIIVIAGLIFILSAQREAFPRIEFDRVIITTLYPGAMAEDIEKLITIPIEDELREIDGIEELNSSSLEARSVVIVKLDPDIENKDKTINDIKNAIDRITDFPEDAEDPVVTELSTAMSPVLEISLINRADITNDKDEFELRKYAKIIEDRLLEIDDVAKIDKKGYREREMVVEVNPDLLDAYHIALNDIIMALSRKNLNFPGGIIKNKKGDVLIRTIGEVQTAKEIEDVLIRANDMGNWVDIGDVASVRDSFEEEEIINKTRNKKAITLTVIKKESADIIILVRKVTAEIDRLKRVLPDNYEMLLSNDTSYFVKRRLKVLINNGIAGFVLVVLSLLISLGWRISLVTALGIPLAFFGTFIWMVYAGISINLISMFGLIMVLGMLVDDAIIVAENVYRYIEGGTPLNEAVINGTSEVIIPVAGTILTTIAAFSPLMFMSGIIGKFIWALPAVVSVALIASWIESMFILPSHIMDIEKRSRKHALKRGDKEGKLFNFFKTRYERMLSAVLNHRYLFVVWVSLFFAGTLVFAKFNVKFILFPAGNIEIIVAKAEAPTGTNIREMSKKLGKIESIITQLPENELDNITSSAGIIQEDPTDPFTKRGSNYGIIMIYLTPDEKRERKAEQIIDWIRGQCRPFIHEFEKLEFRSIRHGPPVGKPVNVTIKGDDFPVLKRIAQEYKDYLAGIDGLKDIKDDFEEKKDELRVFVDEKTAAVAGITVFDIASTIRSCYEGTVATTIRKTDEEIDIRVVFPESLRRRFDSMNRIKIANPRGNLIPLGSVAKFERTQGISLINRKGWRRAISVTADIDEQARNVSSVTVNAALMKKFIDIEERYPGYTVNYEGEFKDTQESVAGLFKSFVVAALIIYLILVSLFRSLVHPIIILGVVPLTGIGVIWTFFFHGLPFSFLALMGLVGLTGVVVNDSIVLVDFIEKSRATGLSPLDASLKAGSIRLRPIFLTTVTTFFGLIPTAYGIGGFDPFLKPMALSLSWGLAFGTLITLFGTPVLYNVFADIRKRFFGKDYEL
jgi:multidrug efflux pump subunit AcrB